MKSNIINLRAMTFTALMTAVICILGPLSIPVGPVPVSLTTFAVFLSVYILGAKKGTLSVVLYLLIGLAGLPVFSGFQGGAAKLFGPTGGYLLGFIPAALIAGFLIEKYARKKAASAFAMLLATAVLYMIGTGWLAVSMHMSLPAALMAGVVPFIPGDIVKILLSITLGNIIMQRVSR